MVSFNDDRDKVTELDKAKDAFPKALKILKTQSAVMSKNQAMRNIAVQLYLAGWIDALMTGAVEGHTDCRRRGEELTIEIAMEMEDVARLYGPDRTWPYPEDWKFNEDEKEATK